jgi:hypothetical protein
MNREQRRRLKLTKAQADAIDRIDRWQSSPNNLKEEDRVKLNFDQITGRTDYKTMNPKYCQFVEENKDNIFTVDDCSKEGMARNMIQLKEDSTWLFWCGDLIKV